MIKPAKYILFVLFCLLPFSLSAAAGFVIQPVNLTCELLENPVGVDISTPAFNYNFKSWDKRLRNIRQVAYQIIVSKTSDFKEENVFWDSRKAISDRMAYIVYAGKKLKSGGKYWWRVRVWDQKNKISAWSVPATFTMGLLDPDEWKAHWISVAGAENYALSPLGYMSVAAKKQDEVKWLQIDLGKVKTFSEVQLYPLFYADRGGYAFPLRFKLETSDNKNFSDPTLLADYTRSDFNFSRYAPAHIKKDASGRYLRLTITKLTETGGGYKFALRQIEVLNAGQNLASGRPVEASDSDENNGFSKSSLTDRVSDQASALNLSSILFRKELKVKSALKRAVIHISGLSQYELTINGMKTGNHLLAPGWTDYKKTVLYDSYDVTSQIKQGNNVLGIFLGNGVYNIQPDTLRYVKFLTTFGPAKAIAQLHLEYVDGSTQDVNTDKTWQASPGPVTYSNLYGGEDYDANLAQQGWDKPGFETTRLWSAAIEVEGPGGKLKGISCAAPPIAAIDTIKPVKIIEKGKTLLIYDFGQNASMMPALQVTGPKGSYVRMIPAELLDSNGLADRRSATQDGVRPAWWQYTLNGTKHERWFPKFFYQGARYLQVELYPSADGVMPQVEKLTDVIVHSTSKPIGAFKCSSPLFNNIYSLVRWAQRSNMMSLMTDCPQREKMGWLEENHLNGPSLRYNFDMAPLFRKTMNDMADAQLLNGLVPNIAPEYFIAGSPALSNGFRNSPEWGSSFIIVPWQQYLFSGDISLLKRYYERMKLYVSFLSSEAKNNIIYTGLGDWYDIGPKEPWGSQLTPVSFTATAIYLYDNFIMQRIALALGRQNDASYFNQAYKKIKDSFNSTFYNKEKGIYGTGSQTCTAMPLFFNIADKQNRQQLLNALVNDIRKNNNSFTTGEVGYRFLLRALADGGRSDIVYEMNNQTDKPGYGYQLKMGATSLTEKWDASVGSFGSQNHFMSGQINEWFFNDVAGISARDDGPGFRKFNINPVILKDLTWASASYNSASGNVISAWNKRGHKINIYVTVPINTQAFVYLPGNNIHLVKEGGRKVENSYGVKFMGFHKGKLLFRVASGYYHFEISNRQI
jgi:alpha-L-rhamnosidase